MLFRIFATLNELGVESLRRDSRFILHPEIHRNKRTDARPESKPYREAKALTTFSP